MISNFIYNNADKILTHNNFSKEIFSKQKLENHFKEKHPWSYWITLHTGVPSDLYQDITRAAPNISGKFNYFEVVLGVFATISWIFLVIWRIKTRKRYNRSTVKRISSQARKNPS